LQYNMVARVKSSHNVMTRIHLEELANNHSRSASQ
jgi:hypothetical protein